MACKRKRSSSTISPFSDSSYASPSERDSSHSPTPLARALYPSSAPDTDMADTTHQPSNWSMPTAITAESASRHLDSRTRKRFRNGRPNERIVHSTTTHSSRSNVGGGTHADDVRARKHYRETLLGPTIRESDAYSFTPTSPTTIITTAILDGSASVRSTDVARCVLDLAGASEYMPHISSRDVFDGGGGDAQM